MKILKGLDYLFGASLYAAQEKGALVAKGHSLDGSLF